MDPKDTKKLERLWREHCQAGLRPGNVPAFEAELRKAQQRHDGSAQARKEGDFEAAYDGNHLLHVMGKEEAQRFFHDTCATHGFPQIMDELLAIGIYRGNHSNDMAFLKDALHTWNRLMRGYHLHLPGSGAGYRFRELIYAMADGDVDLVKSYIPRQQCIAPRGCFPFFRVGNNLMAVLIHDNPNPAVVEKTFALAETYISRKGSPRGSVLVIRYLVALLSGTMDQASDYLQSVAEEYRRMAWLVEFNEFAKYFGIFVHGLYGLAHYALPADSFSRLRPPRHSVFWNEFDRLTKERSFTPGHLLQSLNLTGNLGGLQRLFGDPRASPA
jgi:hypothetical protein